jgi:hypothetical protein
MLTRCIEYVAQSTVCVYPVVNTVVLTRGARRQGLVPRVTGKLLKRVNDNEDGNGGCRSDFYALLYGWSYGMGGLIRLYPT